MKKCDPIGDIRILERVSYVYIASFSPFVGDNTVSYRAVETRQTEFWSEKVGIMNEEDVVSAAIEMLTCFLEELRAQKMRQLFPVRAVALAIALIVITLLIGILQRG